MLSSGLRNLRRLSTRTSLRQAAALALVLLLVAPANAFALAAFDGRPIPAAESIVLTGTVKSIGGDPVGEATVVLRRASESDVKTLTDDAGRFTFSNLREGTATLIALAGEESSVLFVDILPGANEVALTFGRKQWALAVAGSEAAAPPEPQSTPLPQTPAQRDATRPPGTEQRQPVPPAGRPRPADPRIPPGTERPSPQTPPGREVSPPASPAPQTVESPATTLPSQQQPPPSTVPVPLTQASESLMTNLQQRPVPPLPSLERLGITAGDTRPLSLQDAIRLALENNNEIEVARNDVRLSESLLRSFQGVYDPILQFTPLYTHSIRPTSSSLSGSTAGTSSVTTSAFDFDQALIKPVEFWGGNYQVFYNNTRQTTNQRFASLSPLYSSSAGVTYVQPLWRNRGIDANRRNIHIQRKRVEQSDADFRRRTIEIIALVQRSYWDLVFAIRDEQNQVANLNLARENFRRTEASVAAGAVAPLERAEVQTELSNREASLLLSTQSVSIAENNLKNLLLKDPLSPDWTKAFIPTDEPKFDDTPLDLTAALNEARSNRPELRRLRIEQDVNDIDLKYFKNQTKPRIDLSGTFSTTGQAGTPVQALDPVTGQPLPSTVPLDQRGGYFRNLRNLFALNSRDVVLGVTIQIPLRNRTAEANLTSVRIEREQLAASTRLQEQGIEVEVRNAAQSVETARRRVLAARSARENAELQLAGERRLYQVGRSTTFILFQRENSLVNARNQELRAETDYNKALAELQRATSTTLRANNVFIESPVAP